MQDRARARWFWAATIANIVAVLLLLALIYSWLIMLALFASPTSMIPEVLIPSVVLLLSVAGLILTRHQRRLFCRGFGYLIHVPALLSASIVLGYLGLLWSGIGSAEETILIPEGYQGDVFLVYSEPLMHGPKSAIYIIPANGVLVVPAPRVAGWTGWTKTEYFYTSPTGQRRHITELWDSTIPETPDNLANNRDIGIFFPQSGIWEVRSGCKIAFDQFYVGTKSFLLRQYKQIQLDDYLSKNQPLCAANH
jgi:hypothetical protein